MKYQYRDWQKRIIFKDAVYFVTFYTKNRFPFFKEPIFCDLFMENLRLCKKMKGFKLYGWVLLYEHVHLLIQPDDRWNISRVMKSLKENTSCAVNRIMSLESGTTSSHFQKVYHGKYDILSYQRTFHRIYGGLHTFPTFTWHQSFHDHYIRNQKDFDAHLDYIAYNPQKHGLLENWPYVFTNKAYQELADEY